MGASVIHVRCMDKLTEDAVKEIEPIHSSWIEFEVAGEDHSLIALCADDIELWPPAARPVLGRAAVSAQLARGTTRIHGIEINRSSYSRFKRDCLLDRKLQNYVFLGGRLHP